ncbi:amino acid ABC transporter permease [Streptomyces albidoflavus]|uniref:amino acid ABC transporter permease n=1 Tax=Streptomyces albidoflavus TaxID=1886 RepID=UPI00101E5FE2|nr:ABC transporter permease subunit [Streptomyces albidoflavus]RZD96039.1 amino acid ABC transporter permease [Streptomyces albidoflavus]RZD98650.1 amino acid ABC transporter permease [Streptomyces albidoflavus]
MTVLLDHAPEFGTAFGWTLLLIALAWTGAVAVGTAVAAMQLSAVRPARVFAGAYIGVFRNVPLPMQMVLFVFGLPVLGVSYPLFASAVVVLVVYTSAFVAETLRSGLNTVARGEAEAARALGFGPFGLLRFVALPQAFAAVVQPLGGVLITMVKNTSVAAVIGVAEFTFTANKVAVEESETFVVFGAAVIAYVLLGLLLGAGINALEKKVAFQR